MTLGLFKNDEASGFHFMRNEVLEAKLLIFSVLQEKES